MGPVRVQKKHVLVVFRTLRQWARFVGCTDFFATRQYPDLAGF
jgi:hypothetical protein